MVILARCDAGEEVNCGLWLKPYPTFDEPVYLIYNSWDTANNVSPQNTPCAVLHHKTAHVWLFCLQGRFLCRGLYSYQCLS